MQIDIRQETFELDPLAALFWPKYQALFIADVHLGKTEHFRKNGAAVPQNIGQQNYRRLDSLLEKYQPEAVYFLGDLFHSDKNTDWEKFEAWIAQQNTQFTLVKGNHDIIPDFLFERSAIKIVDEWRKDGFLFCHHPQENESDFVICGHVHPGFRLRGNARQQLKLACFYKTHHQLILPAFGAFTGKHYITPQDGEEVFLINDRSIYPLRIDDSHQSA